MELKEGTTRPAYTQPMFVMKEGVKKHSSVGKSNQLSVILSTRSCIEQRIGDGSGWCQNFERSSSHVATFTGNRQEMFLARCETLVKQDGEYTGTQRDGSDQHQHQHQPWARSDDRTLTLHSRLQQCRWEYGNRHETEGQKHFTLQQYSSCQANHLISSHTSACSLVMSRTNTSRL